MFGSPIYVGLITWSVHCQLNSVLPCYCCHRFTYPCSFLYGFNFTTPLCSAILLTCTTLRTGTGDHRASSTLDGVTDVCCYRGMKVTLLLHLLRLLCTVQRMANIIFRDAYQNLAGRFLFIKADLGKITGSEGLKPAKHLE